MITKGDIVNGAFEEARISGLTFNPSAAEVSSAITTLDNMMLSWSNNGICLSYNRSEGYLNVDPSQDSGLSDTSIYAVVLNLCKTLLARYGKQPAMTTLAEAKLAYDNLFDIELPSRESMPYVPQGTGEAYGYYNYSSTYYNRYFSEQENAPVNCKTIDIKVGEINGYNIDFTSVIPEGNTISSFTVTDGQGINVLESSELDGIVTLKCEGILTGYAPVKITLNFDPSGFVDPQTVNFNVVSS